METGSHIVLAKSELKLPLGASRLMMRIKVMKGWTELTIEDTW